MEHSGQESGSAAFNDVSCCDSMRRKPQGETYTMTGKTPASNRRQIRGDKDRALMPARNIRHGESLFKGGFGGITGHLEVGRSLVIG